MDLIRVKIGKEFTYRLTGIRQEVKNGTFQYFTQGEGWKKTKRFEIMPVQMPGRWDVKSWLEIAKICDQYGIDVAEVYANALTAGIVARQTARGYHFIYSKIKHLIDENFNPEFFELLRCDYMLACFGLFAIDIVGLDQTFSKIDADYDAEKATYQGRPCSMREYVQIKYGDKYVEVIECANSTEAVEPPSEVEKIAA